MKRSEINRIIVQAKEFMHENHFMLPQWGYWSLDQWKENKAEAAGVIDHLLGWDITDFGLGDFHRRGLVLFTIRNGRIGLDAKPYAEKIMIVEEGQETPMHFHWSKMEDIICRAGGNLVMELCNSTPDEEFDTTAVQANIDSLTRTVEAKGRLILTPGESICLPRGLYHAFWGEPGKGTVLVGEVSAVNDDNTDNRFYGGIPRFPDIEEDEAPVHLLCGDYARFL
jgi:D-lyxose ketol-isomerase